MQRRELFKFLAAAPMAITAGLPEEKKEQKVTEVLLPHRASPGEIVTVVNTGPGWVVIR